jgi:hypothetical protein
LNEGYYVPTQHHKELVYKNRHILGRIINYIKFCGMPSGHDESETCYKHGIFLDLASEPASLDSVLD